MYNVNKIYPISSTTKAVLLGVLLSIWFVGDALAQASVDSLEAELTRVTGIEKISVYYQLAEAERRINPRHAIEYSDEALRLLDVFPDARLEVDVLYEKGRSFILLGRYDSSAVQAERGVVVASEEGYVNGQAKMANLQGTLQALQGNFHEALPHFSKAMNLWGEAGNPEGYGNALNNLGIATMRLGQLDESLNHNLKSLEVWESLGDKFGIARSLNNTGNVHRDLGNYEDALEFYERAQALREEIGDRRGQASVLNNMGIIRGDLGQLEMAIPLYNRALEIWESLEDIRNVARAVGNLSEVHTKLGNYNLALDYGRQAMEIQQEIGDKRGVAISLNSLGTVYREIGDQDQSLEYYQQARVLSEDVGDLLLQRSIYIRLSEIYENRGEFEQALSFYRKYTGANDSLYNAESRQEITQMQEQYRTGEQRQQIELLERDRQIQQLLMVVLLIGLALILLVVFLVYNRYRMKSRSHVELTEAYDQLQTTHDQLQETQSQLVHQEKMASLGQLTAGIAHEIKNPLNFVNNFAEINEEIASELYDTLSGIDRDSEASELLVDLVKNSSVIRQHGQRANTIVQAMMQLASGGKGQRVTTDINELVESHVDLAYHGKRAQVSDFCISVETRPGRDIPEIDIVPQEIGRVILNLVGNAFDAVAQMSTRGDKDYVPEVVVRTEMEGESIRISVADNGPGVPQELKDKIFEPFFTTKAPGTGTGLGLSLSYDVITQGNGGRITVEDNEKGGSTFVVLLPTTGTPSPGKLPEGGLAMVAGELS